MSLICLLAPLLAASPFLQGFQDSDVEGLRFHRVHLNNGNFIDGQLVKESTASVLLKLRVGEMTIRRDMIDRIEFIKMRNKFQTPIITALPNPGKGEGKPEGKPIDVKVNPEIQKKVDLLLLKLKNSPGQEKVFPREDLEALGDPAVAYMTSRVPEMDLGMMDLIMQGLIVMKTTAANEILGVLLIHEKPPVRSFACTVLGVQNDDMKRTYVRPMLRDRDGRVRATAIALLGSVQEAEWMETVIEVCGDEARDVRNSALHIARRLAVKHNLQGRYLSILTQNLTSSSDDVRMDTVGAIGALGVKESWSSVTRMLNDREARVRTAAAVALTMLAADESGNDVIDALGRERELTTRLALLQVVVRLKLTKAVESLIEWLSDTDETVRKAAVGALRILTGENLGQDRDAWTAWLKKQK